MYVEQQRSLPATTRADQAPDESRTIVSVKIDSIPLRHSPAIHMATYHRATAFPMAIFSNRVDQTIRRIALVVMRAFTIIPAKVGTTRRTCFKEINLFPITRSYIADIQVICQSIKRYTPGIAQAIMPDLVPKWIISRDSIRLSRVDIKSKYLAKKNTRVLGIAKWVALRTAIAQTSVQITIRTKCQPAAIMIWEWLVHTQQFHFSGGIADIGISGDLETRDRCITVFVCVIDKETSVLRILRVKSQTQ